MTEVHAADWVVPVVEPPLHEGAIAIAAGAIVDVGPRDDVLGRHPSAHVEEHGAAAILPGFVNAHTHLEYATYGGFGDGLPFGPWLVDHVRRKRALDADAVHASAVLGAEACLRAGVTCVADCSFAGATVGALRETGLRGTVYLEAFGGGGHDADEVAAQAASRLDALAGVGGPRVRLGVSPHAPYTVAPATYAALTRLARERGLLLATHVAESAAELDAVRDGAGPVVEAMRGFFEVAVLGEHPLARLARDGLLGPDVLVIHAVHVGEPELRLLAETGTPVAHCPRSNALLGCGVAPAAAMLAAGVTVGLGTDSPSSALDLDPFAELRAAILMARAVAQDAGALSPRDALRMGTVDAAAAVGRAGEVGALAVGLRADVVVLELGGTPYWPVEDVEAAVVYGGSPDRVALTLVDGSLRYGKSDDARYRHALERASKARAAMISSSTR